MTAPVKFEIAKLLNSKGLPGVKSFYEDEKHYNLNPKKYTIADVVMWLYEKHGIWIYIKPILDEDGEWIFRGYIKLMTNYKAKEYQVKLLRQPTEAYEAAIKYCLTKLIINES